MVRSARRAWSARPPARGFVRRPALPARAGFSMIEMLFVLIISAILIAMGTAKFESAQRTTAARNARDTFAWFARRARATAVERGEVVTLTLVPDSARARLTDSAGTIDVIEFDQEYGATVSTSDSGDIAVCYGPRGFALASCSNTDLPQTATFARADRAYSARIQVLGQVDRL